MKLPNFKHKYILIVIFIFLIVYLPISFLSYLIYKSSSEVETLQMSYEEVRQAQENFKVNLSEELFNEHLELLEKQSLESKLTALEEEIENVRATEEGDFYFTLNEAYELYGDFEAKVARNDKVELDTGEAQAKIEEWGNMLINQEFETLKTELSEVIEKLDEEYAEYVASLPPPPPPPSSGYSYTTVSTEKGSHGVYLIKAPLSEVRVKTVAANTDNCKDNCPTKSLGDYVNEYGAFAGMNGTYFCPPDYSACGGKVNSFDYALYHSGRGKWLNKDARSWGDTGLFTFRGGDFDFYKKSSEYGGGSVDAAISNYPSLLKNGEVVIKSSILTSFQKVKGTRGALGVGGGNIFLAVITNATVEEAAYAMRALGADHALNLDGGGSTAMFIDGRYILGPGRSLPNAILLTR